MCLAIQALKDGSIISQATLMYTGEDVRVLRAMHALQEDVRKSIPCMELIQALNPIYPNVRRKIYLTF